MKRLAGSQASEQMLIVRLREKGYRLTPQRREIIHFLSGDTSHPSAPDDLKRARKRVPRISMTTVYYTLDMLKREGLIRELEFYDRDNRYDVNVEEHINFICRKCGMIKDITEALPFSFKMIAEQTGFRPKVTRFECYGYCKGCKGKNSL
jgi:Fe2+ or Zn2+ uptake regulation protein